MEKTLLDVKKDKALESNSCIDLILSVFLNAIVMLSPIKTIEQE